MLYFWRGKFETLKELDSICLRIFGIGLQNDKCEVVGDCSTGSLVLVIQKQTFTCEILFYICKYPLVKTFQYFNKRKSYT